MITSQLLHPASIVVVGASNNVHKPGGAILKNLLSGGYTGELRAVNPKETEVQGVAAARHMHNVLAVQGILGRAGGGGDLLYPQTIFVMPKPSCSRMACMCWSRRSAKTGLKSKSRSWCWAIRLPTSIPL